MAPAGRRFSTGLQFLDRLLDGGIPAGSLLALNAPPSSQSELLLRVGHAHVHPLPAAVGVVEHLVTRGY